MTTSSISITRDVPDGQVTVQLVYETANEALGALGKALREVTDDLEKFELEQALGPEEHGAEEPFE